jgi:hypothetical protein
VQQDTFFEPIILAALADETDADLMACLENLLAPDLKSRRAGLKTLVALDAHRRSPLAAAVVARQVTETDLDLRASIVARLAEILSPKFVMEKPPREVIEWARNVLAAMRTREIYALLQVIASDVDQLENVALLMQACSFSGETMLGIVKDRHADIDIRVSAVNAIAAIGYLDARDVLEKLHQRITGQIAGQIPMAFAGHLEAEGELLIPALQKALRFLAEVED